MLTCFSVDNYKVTVYTGNKFLAGTDARVFVELFGKNNGQARNSGEVELAGKKDAFEMGRWACTWSFVSFLASIMNSNKYI